MRNFRSNSVQRRDHYQELTDKIIATLEAGTAPWRRPWNPNACGGSTAPVNAATGHRYRGVNLFVLGISPLAFASGDPRWCSYRQALARGWQVRRGEKATPVYFYKPIEITDKTSEGEGETRRVPILRAFSVFHASQIDGIAAFAPAGATKTVIERVEDAEIILKASGVPVRIGGDRGLLQSGRRLHPIAAGRGFREPSLASQRRLARAFTRERPPIATQSRSVRKIRLISILARRVAGRTFEPARRLRDRFADRYSQSCKLRSQLARRSQTGQARDLLRCGRCATDRGLHPRFPSRLRREADRIRRRW